MLDSSIPYPYDKVTPKHLVSFMFYLNRLNGNEMPRPFETYLRQMQSVIESFGEIDTVKSIYRAFEICQNNSFSPRFMRSLLDKGEFEPKEFFVEVGELEQRWKEGNYGQARFF